MSDNSTVTNQGGFLGRLLFYFSYGFRNIQRGGRWSALAIFCIAAGVATVVALRGLGLSIGESLLGTVRSDNKGDFRLVTDTDDGPEFAMLRGGEDLRFFTPVELASIEAFAAEHNAEISYFTTGGAVQIAGQSGGIISTSQFISSFVIEPEAYPAYGNVRVIEPAGATLDQLFKDGNDIVISENMAESQFLAVGDEVRVARTEEIFIVRGIVGVEAEAGFSNIFAAFFGFAYFDVADVQRAIDPSIGINNVALAFPQALTEENSESLEREFWEETGLSRREINLRSAVEQLDTRQELATVLGDFIVVMGLGALLIGGVGIMNTMLVLVRRRTNEIAALKTFGLKGGQVALLFLAESILLGLAGSVIGCLAGLALGGLVKQYGEQLIQQQLVWGVYPEALLYGMSLGMLVTIIFGLVPIMSSLRIRPGIILRPNDNKVAGLGILQSLFLIIIIVLALGLIVGQIVQPTFGIISSFGAQTGYIAGVIGVAASLAILAILNAMLWVLVWLIGKLPSFGSVDLRLALRNMSSQRWRTATTLLALSAGMFALSSISFVGEGTRELLNNLLSQSFGGNVLVFPIMPANNEFLNNVADANYQMALRDVGGIEGRTTIGTYDSQIISIDGEDLPEMTEDDLEEEIENFNMDAFAPFAWMNLTEWDSTNPLVYSDAFTISAGRALSEADRGQRVLIGPADSAEILGIQLGSILEYRLGRETVSYEVVGLYQANQNFGGSGPVIAPDSLEGVTSPVFQLYTYQVAEEFVPQAVTELSSVSIPPTIAINVGFIDSLLQRFITQFAAIPTIVGLLSLLAAAVIMANTVALSTLERQRQIGILKALGLKSGRVLRIMLIESTIVGLLSALLGLGLSSLIITLFTSFTGMTIPLPTESRGVAIALIVASVLIGWISTFLSANVAVKERVMNVLRYE